MAKTQSQNSDVESESSVHTCNHDTAFCFCAYTPKGACPVAELRLPVQGAWLRLLTQHGRKRRRLLARDSGRGDAVKMR